MMLSQSLKELMASGIVERHQYQEIPPRVEYQITQKRACINSHIPGLHFLGRII